MAKVTKSQTKRSVGAAWPRSSEKPAKSEIDRDELIRKIEEELKRAICLGKFDDPKVLPCLHTYCRKCVEDLVGKSQKKDAIVCPQCRGEHTLPVGGAGKLLTSFTFTNLVKLLEVHKADSKRLTCQNGLDDEPAVARCVECDVYLCNTCCQMHKKMVATKKHNTVSLEEIKATGEKCFQTFHYCPDHENEILKLYCRTCSKTICGDCTYVDHRSHEYVFIKDIQEELRGTLGKKLDTMKKLASELKNEKEKADKAMEEHETNVAAIHAEVDKKFEELSKILKDCQAKMHHEMDVNAKKAEKPIAANVEGIESALAHLISNISFIERLLKSSDACELATMASPTIEQCKKLEAGQQREEVTVCKWKLEGTEQLKERIENISVLQIEAVQHQILFGVEEDPSSSVPKCMESDSLAPSVVTGIHQYAPAAADGQSLTQPADAHQWGQQILIAEQQQPVLRHQVWLQQWQQLQQQQQQRRQRRILPPQHQQYNLLQQQQVVQRAATDFNPTSEASSDHDTYW